MAKTAILIVEDDDLQRMLLVDALSHAGFVLCEAGGADAAIEAMTGGRIFAAVVTNVRLLGPISGFQLTIWIRKNYPDTAVVLTSGDATKEDAIAELCGSHHFMPKPFHPDRLIELLRRLTDPSSKTGK